MSNSFIVQFDCTDRLEKVLLAIADGLRQVNETSVSPKPKTKKQTPPKVEKTEETDVKQEEVHEEVQPKVIEVKVKAPESDLPFDYDLQEQAPSSPKKEETFTAISDVDIRKAIKDCRDRFGADPIIQKVVKEKLKAKVNELGYPSSTNLPQELRPVFIEFAATLEIPEAVEKPLPF